MNSTESRLLENLIIDNQGLCKIKDVLQIIKTSGSHGVLVSGWSALARELQISEPVIDELRQAKTLDKIEFDDLLSRLLQRWIDKNGKKATLLSFVSSLKRCNHVDVAEKLQGKFLKIVKENVLAHKKFEFQGRSLTVKEIFNELNIVCNIEDFFPFVTEETYTNYKIPSKLLQDIYNNKPVHYIERKLSCRTKIDPKIFEKDNVKDIFVFRGMDATELQKLAKERAWIWSSDQERHGTVSFVLLEKNLDFKSICDESSHPVHLIDYKKRSFYWIKSSGDISLIQQYIHHDHEQEQIDEKQFVNNTLKLFSTMPVCISDKPGMGKTELLKSIARKVEAKYSDRLVLFLDCNNIMKQLKFELTSESAVKIFLSQCSSSFLSAEILKHLIWSGKIKAELFFDGFDELTEKHRNIAISFLQEVQQLGNIRVYVTTRVTMRDSLENKFETIGYNIAPFTESNQIDLLCNSFLAKNVNPEKLREFSRQCLQSLRKETEHECITGTPLICRMLAEVYSEEAQAISQNNERTHSTIMISSTYDLYNKLMESKLNEKTWSSRSTLAGDNLRDLIKKFHVRAAFVYLFYDKLDFLSCIRQSDKVSITDVCSAGIMYQSSKDMAPTFFHRTFAEYLVAEHLVNEIRKENPCKDCMLFLMQSVLGEHQDHIHTFLVDLGGEPFRSNLFQFQLIAYFVNEHMKKTRFVVTEQIKHAFKNIPKMCALNPYKTLSACCAEDFSYCYQFAANILLLYGHKRFIKFYISTDIWSNMILIAAQFSTDKIVKNVVDQAKHGLKKSLDEIVFPYSSTYNINITPLHIACFRGSLKIYEYLSGQYKDSIFKMKRLLRFCLRKSILNSSDVIEEKQTIISLLLPKLIEYTKRDRSFSDASSWIQPHIHVNLLETVLEQLHNKNHVNQILTGTNDTYMHVLFRKLHGKQYITPKMYADIFRILKQAGFVLFKHANISGQTPLHIAVENIEVDQDVLIKFKEEGADFNASDAHFNSVLFYAIRGGRNDMFIKNLVSIFGCNVKQVNSHGHSSLHFASAYGNYEAVQYLVNNKKVDINSTDWCGSIPLHIALQQNLPKSHQIQEFLINRGSLLEHQDLVGLIPIADGFKNGVKMSHAVVCEMENCKLNLDQYANTLMTCMIMNQKLKSFDDDYRRLFHLFFTRGGSLEIPDPTRNILQNYLVDILELSTYGQLIINKALELSKIDSTGIKIETSTLNSFLSTAEVTLEAVLLAMLETVPRIFEEMRIKIIEESKGRKISNKDNDNVWILKTSNMNICHERVLEIVDGLQDFREDRLTVSTGKYLRKEKEISRSFLEKLSKQDGKFIVVTERILDDVPSSIPIHNVDQTKEYDKLVSFIGKIMGNLGRCYGHSSVSKYNKKYNYLLKTEFVSSLLGDNGHYLIDMINEYIYGLNENEILYLEELSVRLYFWDDKLLLMKEPNEKYAANLKNRKILKYNANASNYNFRYECIGWYFVAQKIEKTNINWQTYFNRIFETKKVHLDISVDSTNVTFTSFSFENNLLVYFVDLLTTRDFCIESQDRLSFMEACVNSSAHNIIRKTFQQVSHLQNFGHLVHLLVRKTIHLPNGIIEERKKFISMLVGKDKSLLEFKVEGMSPLLMDAVHADLLKHLIDLGANITICTKTKRSTFLHLAPQYLPLGQFQDLVKFLLRENYVDIFDMEDVDSCTPVHKMFQCLEVDKETMYALDSKQIKFGAIDKNGKNALHYAIEGDRGEFTINCLKNLVLTENLQIDIQNKSPAINRRGNEALIVRVENNVDLTDEIPITYNRDERFCTRCGAPISEAVVERSRIQRCINCKHLVDFRKTSNEGWSHCRRCDVFVHVLFRYCYMCCRENPDYRGKLRSRTTAALNVARPKEKYSQGQGPPIFQERKARYCILCAAIIPDAAHEKQSGAGCDSCSKINEYHEEDDDHWHPCVKCDVFLHNSFQHCYFCRRMNEFFIDSNEKEHEKRKHKNWNCSIA